MRGGVRFHRSPSIGPLGDQPIRRLLVEHSIPLGELAAVVNRTGSNASAWVRGFSQPPDPERLRKYLSRRLKRDVAHDELWTWAP
jgi:hypothetical protein